MKKFVKGFYMTVYGNVAFVSSKTAKTGYDVDMGERIPIEMIDLNKFVRKGKSRRD